jgi:predicted RNA binding protein YcfA (HicA-like mRNA interferase family)
MAFSLGMQRAAMEAFDLSRPVRLIGVPAEGRLLSRWPGTADDVADRLLAMQEPRTHASASLLLPDGTRCPPPKLRVRCPAVQGMAKAGRVLAALKRDGWIETRRSGFHRVLARATSSARLLCAGHESVCRSQQGAQTTLFSRRTARGSIAAPSR